MEAKLLFQFRDFSYRYRRQSVPTLKHISFSVEAGEIVAVLGKSGSGKTTLAQVLSGIIPGAVTTGIIQGKAEKNETVSVGLVTQSPENQLFGYTVEDAIAFGLENQHVPRHDMEKQIDHVLALLHISHLRRRVVEKLSGGQKQAVCIASVLVMKPDLLVLDEPVSSLDPLGKSMVQDILFQLKEAGQSVIILDQFIDWCADCVNSVLGLEEGKIIFAGTLKEFFEDPLLYKRLGVTVPSSVLLYHRLRDRYEGFPLRWNAEALGDILRGTVRMKPCTRADAEEKADGVPLIEVRHLRHCYGSFEALSDVEARFYKGRVTSVLGQNGSGKTTLVHHLNGLLRPTAGEVLLHGRTTAGMSVAELSRFVALVFQNPEHMLFENTVAEEISFSGRMHGTSLSDEEMDRWLDMGGLKEYKEAFPLNLSMGQKHMTAILCAAASSPEAVIFDEPTLGLDLDMKERLAVLIKRLKEMGVCVILISHELSFVCEVSDSILLLHEGKIAYEGTPKEVFAQRSLFAEMKMPLPDMEVLSDALGFPEPLLTDSEFIRRTEWNKGGHIHELA